MKRQDPSIFNDIMGPYMIGPSSSHTCAPSRIGYLSRQLLDKPLKKAIIEFAKDGAYTDMYQGQKSDLGFVNGLLGNKPEDPNLRNSISIAKSKGIEIEFKISDYEPIVPNISKLFLYDDDDNVIEVHSDSTGSGTVKLLNIDGFETSIIGDCYELLIKCYKSDVINIEKYLNNTYQKNEGLIVSYNDDLALVNLKLRQDISIDVLSNLESMDSVIWVKTITPVISILSNRNAILPFRSAKELLEISNKENKEIWELAIEYEMARSGLSEKELVDKMIKVIETMEYASLTAINNKIEIDGIIEPSAGKIDNYLKTNPNKFDMGVLDTAVSWAIATMEYSNAMGVVLCAPTGGSAGVFPGAILGVAHHMNWTEKEKVKAMFVTAIIGIVMSKDYTYSAELYGCQVEPGAASGMAAAGLTAHMGGTSEQILQSASSAVQNILGTICDPVAGLVQIPCINRNAMSVGNAIISSNMVLGGFDPLIPLDQVAETLFRVGMQLPSELRCTCKGGLCTTDCGQQLAKEQDERNALFR